MDKDVPGEMPTSKQRPFVLHARVVTGTGGGPDKTILNSPRFLREHGYESLCVFFRPPDDPGFDVLRSRSAALNAPLVEIDDCSKLDLRAIHRAVKLCRQHHVSIWHAHDYKTNLIGLIAKRFHPMKLITTAHGWVNFSGHTPRYYRFDKRWLLPRFDRVICVSPSVLQECHDAGVTPSKCLMIENAIDETQFCRQRSINEAKRERFGAPRDQLVVGAIGRLADEKGFDLLIEAFKRVISRGTNAMLVIAGEGPDEDKLRQQINQSGIAERIKLVGFCQDTRAFLESLDVFVLSSLREGLPNVVLEAMAVGTAVIATRVGGVERLVEDGLNGKLIVPGDVDQIADEIIELIQSPEQRDALSRNAVKSIAENWSFRRRMERVVNLYQDVLSSAPSGT